MSAANAAHSGGGQPQSTSSACHGNVILHPYFLPGNIAVSVNELASRARDPTSRAAEARTSGRP